MGLYELRWKALAAVIPAGIAEIQITKM